METFGEEGQPSAPSSRQPSKIPSKAQGDSRGDYLQFLEE
jgi:hypothetical protein